MNGSVKQGYCSILVRGLEIVLGSRKQFGGIHTKHFYKESLMPEMSGKQMLMSLKSRKCLSGMRLLIILLTTLQLALPLKKT